MGCHAQLFVKRTKAKFLLSDFNVLKNVVPATIIVLAEALDWAMREEEHVRQLGVVISVTVNPTQLAVPLQPMAPSAAFLFEQQPIDVSVHVRCNNFL